MLNIKIYNTNVYIAVRNEVSIIPRRRAIDEIYTWRSFWKNFPYLRWGTTLKSYLSQKTDFFETYQILGALSDG